MVLKELLQKKVYDYKFTSNPCVVALLAMGGGVKPNL